MRISVCMGVRNVEDYIEDCLLSIMCQSRPADEIVVVDDCSTDNTYNLLKNFGKKIKLGRTSANLGSPAARNKAVSYADGDYIKFFDGDDLLLYTALSSLEFTASETGADVIYGRGIKYMLYKPVGVHKLWTENPYVLYADAIERDPPEVNEWNWDQWVADLKQVNHFWFGTTFVRRSAFDDVGGFDGTLYSAGDWDLWIRMALAEKKFAKCNDLIYILRGHSESKTMRYDKRCQDQAELVWRRHNQGTDIEDVDA